MPLKTTRVQHVYEISFRVISDEELDLTQLKEGVEGLVRESLWAPLKDAGDVDVREMCFDQDGGEYCLMTEGHRGLHEGVSGKKWGHDL